MKNEPKKTALMMLKGRVSDVTEKIFELIMLILGQLLEADQGMTVEEEEVMMTDEEVDTMTEEAVVDTEVEMTDSEVEMIDEAVIMIEEGIEAGVHEVDTEDIVKLKLLLN